MSRIYAGRGNRWRFLNNGGVSDRLAAEEKATRQAFAEACKAFHDEFLLKSMMKQAGVSREQFYAATGATAKKIGVEPSKQPKIAFWPSFQAMFSGCGHTQPFPLEQNPNKNHTECFVCHPELRKRPLPGRCPSCAGA